MTYTACTRSARAKSQMCAERIYLGCALNGTNVLKIWNLTSRALAILLLKYWLARDQCNSNGLA